MTNAEFAEAIDVQPSNISHIMSGRNKPSLDLVMKVLKRFPELRTEWLIHGKGAMNREYSLFDATEKQPTPKQAPLLFSNEVKEVHEPVDTEKESPRSEPETVKPKAPGIEVKDLDSAMSGVRRYPVKKEEQGIRQPVAEKKLEKIVLFYDDQTFREYNPG
jgi:transcriptional regulator with XRE-family HTH domain